MDTERQAEIQDLQKQARIAENAKQLLEMPAWQAIAFFMNTQIQESYRQLAESQQHRLNVVNKHNANPDVHGVVEYITDDMHKGTIKALVGISDYIVALVQQGESALEALQEIKEAV